MIGAYKVKGLRCHIGVMIAKNQPIETSVNADKLGIDLYTQDNGVLIEGAKLKEPSVVPYPNIHQIILERVEGAPAPGPGPVEAKLDRMIELLEKLLKKQT